jgi:hypothetical protein
MRIFKEENKALEDFTKEELEVSSKSARSTKKQKSEKREAKKEPVAHVTKFVQNKFTKILSEKKIPVSLLDPLILKMRDPSQGILTWKGVNKPEGIPEPCEPVFSGIGYHLFFTTIL